MTFWEVVLAVVVGETICSLIGMTIGTVIFFCRAAIDSWRERVIRRR